jgi:hypothetical protein
LKLADFIHQYPAGVSPSRFGLCRVRVFPKHDDEPVVLLTDVGGSNCGPSVTNAAESVVGSLIECGFVPANARFIEHYEKDGLQSATFDALTVRSGSASWQAMTLEEVLQALDCAPDELAAPTHGDARLAAQLARQRHRLAPRADLPYVASVSSIQRQLQIESGMISKSSLRAAVALGAGERQLQRIIRSDLSLLGEIYAKDGEYICFSEFPIGDGFVDFAVFTGRSRMEVFLIEVKGADFDLVNSGHYQEFNAKINQAAGQVRKRYRAIYEALPEMRRAFHEVRAAVEAGKPLHNSFVGSGTPLGVDPNKDIYVYAVIIGGRTKDDLTESRLRHDYETSFTPKVKVDSWETWINKLQRE